MEWLTSIRDAIEYMENHLQDIRSPEEVADHVHISCMYLQRGFQILTGYTLGEYIRNRRLYLAALEVRDGVKPVIEIAYDSGYETPASFDKAFHRFHGATPMEVRKGKAGIRTFQRMSVSIEIRGGTGMKFTIEKKDSIRIVGFERVFDMEDSYQTIPAFWEEATSQYAPHLMQGQPPQGETECYIAAHHIGELGVCVDDLPGSSFRYFIAGYRTEDPIPDGMTAMDLDAGEWAVFDCTQSTLQATNTAIWKEWLPGNSEYELSGRYNVEWYSPEGMPGPDQKCQIWLPVRRVKR